ncbi:hypothetical protein AB0I51_41675 [Streptomyces sp. NPDC050549]|uniref:hypothetical protein n=1 Tax=Streptomyces sp. NPDC050549 TaxID=3155406 RepID=UPI003415EBCA
MDRDNAFRQVGGALGPAVPGVLLTARALHTLPGHLAADGTGGPQQGIVSAVDAGEVGAVTQMNLGADTGQTLGAPGFPAWSWLWH